ncbi:MAG: EcsC family protein [Lachnospiraceae bacterium]
MELFQRKSVWEQEWESLLRKEKRFLKKYREKRENMLNKKLEQMVPQKLQVTLDSAFYKAFQLVFEKGTDIIEKTYQGDKQRNQYKINEYTAQVKKDKKSWKAFDGKAQGTRVKNLLITGAEGVGLGVLGIGIPDIPLFTAVILKSIYEIAISYGSDYRSEEEELFILKIIENAMESGDTLQEQNALLNQNIYKKKMYEADKETQIKRTASVLSREMLYMKFLQGIPVAGVVGGLYDSVYLGRITEYAELKYKRRFLGDYQQKEI